METEPQPQRVYGGASAPDRQARRRESLLDAALSLIAEQGVAGVTLRAVTRRAGVGSRYLYESFTGCDDLVLAAYDQQIGVLLARYARVAVDTPTGIAERIEGNVDATVAFLAEDPRRGRMLVESDSSAALRERRRQMIGAVAQTMVDQAEQLLPANTTPHDRLMLRSHVLAAGCLDLATEWVRGTFDLTEQEFARTLTDMLHMTVDIAD